MTNILARKTVRLITLVALIVMTQACATISTKYVSRIGKVAPKKLQKRTHIVLLGTGTPNADPEKHGQAVAIIVKGETYIIDCGPGIVRRANEAYQRGVDGLKPSKLDKAFLTHLHSDHTVGLPDLVFTPWVLNREKPLALYGPPGTEAMAYHVHKAYEEDVKVRIEGSQPSNLRGHEIQAKDSKTGLIYEDKNVKVIAFKAKHGAWKYAYGYRFKTPDIDICHSGDTIPYEEMKDNYKNCDVLIHEVYSDKGFSTRPTKWQKYHRKSHTSTSELAKIARKVKPTLLVLNHQLTWGTTNNELIEEIKETYKGRIISGKDLLFIGLSDDFKSKFGETEQSGKFIILPLQRKPLPKIIRSKTHNLITLADTDRDKKREIKE